MAAFSLTSCRTSTALVSKSKPSNKPNVVFIMADDMGYGDAECFGNEKCNIPTPHVDRLANEGMKFTNAVAFASHCVPSRMAIMTGRYPFRFESWRKHTGGPWGFIGPVFPDTTFSLGDLMSEAGYATNYIGKWHLGLEMTTFEDTVQTIGTVDYSEPVRKGPTDYGFDECFILPGSLDMYPYVYIKNDRWVGKLGESKGWSAFNRVGPTAENFEDTLVLDAFCKEAEEFINRFSVKNPKDEDSFFMYLSLTSPHTPLAVTSKFRGESPIGLYGDFVMETDHCVGRILAALEKGGLDENTIVIVTSDHGPAPYAGRIAKATQNQLFEMEKEDGHYARGPFRGCKFTIYEGGVRVPFMVKWPGIVDESTVCDRNISLMDLMATLADLVGYNLEDKGPDSFSFLPLLKSPVAPATRTSCIIESDNSYSIRQGDWKLVMSPTSGANNVWEIPPVEYDAGEKAIKEYGNQPENLKELESVEFVQLFNLKEDIEEQNNLAKDNPEKVRALFTLFHQQVENGRTTNGGKLKNDWSKPPKFILPPRFVMEE